MGFHHSSSVETYFSILKRGVIGTFHHVGGLVKPRMRKKARKILAKRRLARTGR
jgi:hypothetical protein